MTWNWQQADWPNFTYKRALLDEAEAIFLRQSGMLVGSYRHVSEGDKATLTIDLMSNEAFKTSEIEGEILNRESLHSSIRRHFGFDPGKQKILPAERGIADMMVDIYRNYADPLSHETMFTWHRMITAGRADLNDIGQYRTHEEAMQVVSGAIYKPKVHFEAPPSKTMKREMTRFVDWFNKTAPNGSTPSRISILSAFTRLRTAMVVSVEA